MKSFYVTGAQNDLERITQMAYQQVAVYGMSKTVGLVSFPPRDDQFNKPYSNETAVAIDREVRNIVDEAYDRCLKLLASKKDLVEKLALTLLDKEVPHPISQQSPLSFRSFMITVATSACICPAPGCSVDDLQLSSLGSLAPRRIFLTRPVEVVFVVGIADLPFNCRLSTQMPSSRSLGRDLSRAQSSAT